MSIEPLSERPHAGCVDEWVFAAWTPDARSGIVSGHRLLGTRSWYWFALVEAGHPLLQITEWDVRVRADPFVVKAPEMWAEHQCVAAFEQWTIGNEAHAVALDDPDEALGRAYGVPTPIACDIEWYATGPAVALGADDAGPSPIGFVQDGVAHGLIELLDRRPLEWVEVPARRWRRWAPDGLAPLALDPVRAHTGLRAPFRFPDGGLADWVLTAEGWRRR